MNIRNILFLMITLLFVSCKKDKKPQPIEDNNLQLITKMQDAEGYQISLYAKNPTLETGYNQVYFKIQKPDGSNFSSSNFSFSPLMHMHTMSHSAPFEAPVYLEEKSLFEAAVIFTMPSGDMGDWELQLKIEGRTLQMPIEISNAPTRVVGSYEGSDSVVYVLSLIPPQEPWKTGLNDLEIAIYSTQNKMDFIPYNDFQTELEPEMPSMGHGSPNNQNPESIGNGRYKGKVNYTMTGDWRLHFKLKRDGEIIVDNAFIDILF